MLTEYKNYKFRPGYLPIEYFCTVCDSKLFDPKNNKTGLCRSCWARIRRYSGICRDVNAIKRVFDKKELSRYEWSMGDYNE